MVRDEFLSEDQGESGVEKVNSMLVVELRALKNKIKEMSEEAQRNKKDL